MLLFHHMSSAAASILVKVCSGDPPCWKSDSIDHVLSVHRYEFQMQFGSIGWSVGATLGYAQALKGKKRVIASIGDGSFQVTAQVSLLNSSDTASQSTVAGIQLRLSSSCVC